PGASAIVQRRGQRRADGPARPPERQQHRPVHSRAARRRRLTRAMFANALTVDVEEWFHVCGVEGPIARDRWDALPSRVVGNTRDLLAMFDRRGARATFFVLGWVAERYPDLIGDILAAGHEVASHGHSHRRIYELTPDQFAADLDATRAALTAAGAAAVIGFRAPEWSINDRSLWALDVLARKSYAYDSSMAPLRIIGNPQY